MRGRHRVPPAAIALFFAALAITPGCSGGERQAAPRPVVKSSADDPIGDLRRRVDELERRNAEDRARDAEELASIRRDVDDLRATLDQADRQLAALSGGASPMEPGNATAAGEPEQHSAHAALRERLRHMYDASREAVERLGRSLDRSLERTRDAKPPPQDK